MKFLKNIALCLFVAVSVAGVSTTAYAEASDGRINYTPADAINLVLERIKTAQDAIAAGKSGKEVAELIKSAKDASKEINANDKVDIARGRANGHLGKAISEAKNNDTKEAAVHLKAAEEGFAGLKKLL